MVVKPRNRATSTNAKEKPVEAPVTLCGTCKEAILEHPTTHEERSMECECCMNWYHTECGKLAEVKYNAITEHDLTWYCPSCDKGAKKLKQHILNLTTEQESFRTELRELKTKVEQSENNIIENINSNLDEKIDARIEARLNDI